MENTSLDCEYKRNPTPQRVVTEAVNFIVRRNSWDGMLGWPSLTFDNFQKTLETSVMDLNIGPLELSLPRVGDVDSVIITDGDPLYNTLNYPQEAGSSTNWLYEYHRDALGFEGVLNAQTARDFFLEQLKKVGIDTHNILQAIITSGSSYSDGGVSIVDGVESDNPITVYFREFGYLPAISVFQKVAEEFKKRMDYPLYRSLVNGSVMPPIQEYNSRVMGAQDRAFIALLVAWRYLEPVQSDTSA